MTHTNTCISRLSNEDLLAEVQSLASLERRATGALIRALMELDARRLFLREGCSSLFTYCTQILHVAEGAAYNRIEAARAARHFPILLDGLEDGSLTLTAVRLLAPHLTPTNHRDVLASARFARKRDVERLVASLAPKPPVPSTIRKLPDRRPSEPPPNQQPMVPDPAAIDDPFRESTVPRPLVVPLAPERYRIQLTISRDTHDKLRRVQDLMRHTVPSGDLAEIVDRALTAMLEKLESRRCAAVGKPRTARATVPGSRHVPASVRREVWQRDEGRCAFQGMSGRCTETAFLEFHHVEPHAVGGEPTVENIALRCRAHNQFEAALFFADESTSP